jgi:hypothetical protein
MVQAALNPIAGDIRKAREILTPHTAPAKTAEATVAERLAAVERQGQVAQRQLRQAAIEKAALVNGVPEERLKMFTKVFEGEFTPFNSETNQGVKIKEEDNSVVHINEVGEEKSVGELVKAFLFKPDGEIFKKAQQLPGGKGLRGGSQQAQTRSTLFDMMQSDPAGYAKLTPEDRQRMAAEDFKAANARG